MDFKVLSHIFVLISNSFMKDLYCNSQMAKRLSVQETYICYFVFYYNVKDAGANFEKDMS